MASLAGCAAATQGRDAEIVGVITRADAVILETRPGLTAGKYEQMAATPFAYFRGSMAVERHDWERAVTSASAFDASALVTGVADPHPENFGILIARDGTAALEPNDLDATDRVPWLFEVRRLVAGLAVAAAMANPGIDVRSIGRASAQAYAEAITSAGVPLRLTDAGDSTVLADLFRRSARDFTSRAELNQLTELRDGARRFKRGQADGLAGLPPVALAALPALVDRAGQGTVIDAVRVYGSGIASFPRVRVDVLLSGATDSADDDVIVEVKELTVSPLAGWYGPALTARDAAERVEAGAHQVWARPDADAIFFGAQWLGLPVVVRTESEAFKGIRINRWEGDRGSQVELQRLAQVLGRLLARMHHASASAIAAEIARDPAAFADEQADFAVTRGAQIAADHALFAAALQQRGPTLGTPATPQTRPGTDVKLLFGDAP